MMQFPTKMATHFASQRALVVDDSALTRRLHCAILERLGFDVVSVSNGLQAVTAAAGTSFDVILMDCQMPVMDGLAATRILRKMEQGSARSATVIGVTASETPGECSKAGMNDCLSKPLHTDTLVQSLHTSQGSNQWHAS